MSTSRRQFLQYSMTAASMLAVAPAARAGTTTTAPRAAAPKKILVLGGTSFLGPAVVNAAKARGHTLTLFNRGKTRPELFPDVEKLRGDRDPKKDEGLKALNGRKWDAVIDTSGYFPRMVQASAELLAPNVKQYIFISTISVYASDKTPGEDETGALAKVADPSVEGFGKDYEFYGGFKALCEQAAEKAMPGRVAHIRSGYIVGPEDRTDRFTYWPVRFAEGGEMLAPGAPADPLQIIDVRDLAEWIVQLIETDTCGTFNASGPEKLWTMGDLFTACREATGKDTKLTWVPAEFLAKNGEKGDGSIPIWTPPIGDTRGYHLRSHAKAMKAGLKFRPAVATLKDTLAWWNGLPEERRAKPRAGLPRARETELLALWAKAQSAPAGESKAK